MLRLRLTMTRICATGRRAGLGLWLPCAAQAASADPSGGTGPWTFASIALVLVAGLAYAIGRLAARPRPHSTPPPQMAPVAARGAHTPGPDGDDRCGPEGGTALALILRAAPAGLRLCRRSVSGQWEADTAASGLDGVAADPLAGLPAAVRQATQALPHGQRVQADSWHLLRAGQGDGERLLLWQATPTPPDESAVARESAAFSYTVSHDLRAPLRVVEGFARILKEDYGRQFDRIGNDHLDRVLGAAARMNAMIDAMLSLASLSTQPLARQPVDLSQLAAYIVEDLRRNQPQRHVEVQIEPGLRAVGDPTLLRLMLENLLANAWKYTGGREQPRIDVRTLELEKRRVYEVQDNGAGFDMRHADRLFGLFQRLHGSNEFPGTGVGLASVQRIVRRHGGDIWAESSPGQGARFRFTLSDLT
jgi:signal transduction histidine kinase